MPVLTDQSGIGMSTSGGSGGAHRLSQFLGSLAEKDIDCTELAVRTRNPIFFQPTVGGKTAYGYEATILADICDAVTSAQRAGVLLKQQRLSGGGSVASWRFMLFKSS